MRWKRGVGRGQIEDRRGAGGGFGGGGLPIPIGVGGGLGGAGLVVVLALVLLNALGGGGGGGLGVDPIDQLPATPGAPPSGGLSGAPDPDAELRDFVAFVVADVQDSWSTAFAQGGRQYERTKLVLFTGAVRSGCGVASAETGPFYCPLDRKVYLDLGFFREQRNRFGAPGDFAQAYVIAHEFGHHVQNVLGVNEQVRRAQQDDPDKANDLSIRLELQADCLAGVWGHSAYQEQQLEQGDLEEGIAAAAAVGDDRIQREATGRISPESWTHGSSEQRVSWFRRGFEKGDANSCDTFSGDI